MNNFLFISIGKIISKISKSVNRGNGSTWPGHIALKGNPNFIRDIFSTSKTKVIIVAGTNGKTTTSGLIQRGLEKNGSAVLQNDSGANLLNGVASSVLLNTNSQGKLTQDYAIFEVDENALPLVLGQITPDYLVLLNLFRDQLDRYGEINTIANKWQTAIDSLSTKTTLVLNADDPQIAAIPAFLKKTERKVVYFGLQDKHNTNSKTQQAADSISCPKCGSKLLFHTTTFSHLGNWSCTQCGLKRPKSNRDNFTIYPLAGIYNQYNTHAAALTLQQIGLTDEVIISAFKSFKPAFGRQEVIRYKNTNIQLFLSKNPTSFNQSFRTIRELKAKTLLIVLNDRIPDGRDISWIWDVDLSESGQFKKIILAGDRIYDMALRFNYELGKKEYNNKIITSTDLRQALMTAITLPATNETLYILPTYSAMLDVRKILTGKKIL